MKHNEELKALDFLINNQFGIFQDFSRLPRNVDDVFLE